jgi:hypothetical protein
MWSSSLTRTLHSFLNIVIHSLARIASSMWNNGVRFGFGARAPQVDEEAARLLLAPQEVVPEQDAVMADHGDPIINTTDSAQALHNDHHSFVDTYHSFTPDPTLSFQITTLNQLLETAKMQRETASIPSRSGDTNNFNGTRKLEYTIEDTTQHISSPSAPQPDYGEPFLTITPSERLSLDVIFAPIRCELEKLYETTPESLPAYNPGVKANSHAQVLKMRLSPIAEFIEHFLEDVVEDKRGMIEMKL